MLDLHRQGPDPEGAVVGKIYQFECEMCGYRAAVAGGVTEGRDLKVCTVVCKECRAIHDSVTAIRTDAKRRLKDQLKYVSQDSAPSLGRALARLPVPSRNPRRWHAFELSCPRDPTHHVQPWTAPARCPRCKAYMEPAALPYRVWD